MKACSAQILRGMGGEAHPPVVPQPDCLEREAQCELDVAAFLDARVREATDRDHLEIRTDNLVRAGRGVQIGVVEQVKELTPELELLAFPGQTEVLQYPGVDIPDTRGT